MADDAHITPPLAAHTRPLRSGLTAMEAQAARERLDDQEAPIDRIGALASAAGYVIDSALGNVAPARELRVICSLIEDLAKEAQAIREDTWNQLRCVRD